MARTLRLDLLDRTNIAVGSDLPITSWMVRHAAWLLSHFQARAADGKTAYARQFEKPYESLVLPFAELVAPAGEVEEQLGLWSVVGQNTDKQCSSHWYKIGHRGGSHDSTSTGVRTRGGKSGGGHEGHTRGRTTGRRGSWRRPHRDEARWGAKRGDCGSCELWRSHARGQWRRRQRIFKSSSELAQVDGGEDRDIRSGRGKQPSSKWVKRPWN